MGNRDVTPLLEMPSFIDFCPGMVAFYSITMPGVENGRQELQTDSDRLIVRPTAPLDRELRGDSLPFTIKCTLRAGKRRLLAPQIKEAMLTVIDEDDSAPIRSRNPIVDWHYNNKSDDLDDQLLVLDPDLTDTNNYMVELIGNIYNLVTIESVTEFGIRSELCMKEAENVTAYNFNAFCTLIAPVVKFKETGLHAKLPPKIHFSVVFIDRNLLPSIAQEKKQVKYSVTLTLPNYEEEVKPTPLHALTHNTDNGVLSPETIALLKELPPSELNITIIPPVNQYYRLGQLIYPNVTQLHFNSYLPANAAFILTSDSVNVSIKVTPITGILYVSDPDGLRSGEFTIVRGDSVTLVTLTVVEQVNFPCSSQNPEEVTPWCASIRYSSECQETCGLGAAGTCSWRPLETEKGKTQYTKYATCSPALDTCPNNICDELEYTFTGICPQDCMYGKKKTNNHMTIGPRGRGIQAGLGVCTCDDYACQCFPDYQTRPSPSPGVEPPLKEPAPASSLACGRGCKVGISVAAVVFLGFTLLSVVFCRRHASGNGKQKGGVISLGTLANEERSSSVPYNTRDETHDSLIHGIRASPRPDHNLVPALNLTLCSQIDRKWEFPRSRLVIEQTLGEGEFGKVMKARAQGIGGNLGYTTVAVKMLKSNSTQVELSDLLSEYTLLKEVSHPNVVRLLGACTGKGGPVYIIIEYCQYGSLRNYLKRSRHAEFENRVGSGPTEIAAGDYAITPKDLLSFAWQICKGMAYLTDMKLVHRDLAARNVLLAAGKVCKISDFGLTRDVYEGDLYFKRSKGRVPVKWMALESLVDHVYTSKSDVWGFGVLLWELVTLGTPPYPGVTPERLFSLLKAGYRMEKPDNCSQELYDVMLQCWAEDPARRPCFQELTDIFDAMIQADVEYLELRSLIVTNRGYFDGVPEPSQQFLEAPPQFQDSPQPPVGPINEEREASTQGSTHQGAPPQLNIDETQLPIQQDWSPPGSEQLDSDSYLVARTDLGAPRRAESTEPLLAPTSPPVTAAHTPTITTSHAHNPAYSPTSEIPHPTPLHYSTLASRPDEEDAHNLRVYGNL
ncbi:proto-oncogene tyrosine-protein kinase receptor Ret-like isoform X2 [Homarus americanus]|uniref:proto-oncogene tyrosine-protein kinase receptor Ret-like isoform X2 n=1 Tax=Homarus americanus TaxID=6706 RepID=UPI001C489D44|nr:proto-oncogene tyrosine-protein kinase receptor Ret-like isoform X2 [Homarus americanus]